MRLMVIGGGAAGFFCAVNAARMNPALEVIILEKSSKLLSKVRVSGGGRCNVTHACFDINDMAAHYPRGSKFVKKAFYQFFTKDTIRWFEERGVKLKTEEDGRMFPVTDSSETIVRTLLNEADRYGVAIRMNRDVRELSRIMENGKEKWKLLFATGEHEIADMVCVASGGYPKEGMFTWLLPTGHTLIPPVPSLFTFNMPGNPLLKLMGVSTRASIKLTGTKLEEEGPVLITHWGLSGPAVLKLSARGARDLHAMNYNFKIQVNWIPEYNEQTISRVFRDLRSSTGAQKVIKRSVSGLPLRLWEHLCEAAGIGPDMRWGDVPAQLQHALARTLTAHQLEISGKTTFKEEFVTAGGINLSEVDPATMKSRLQQGLYFAGEVLDVDGVTGGFNFQHAWTSGWIAARNMGTREITR